MRFLLPFFPVACLILITPAISRAQDVSRPNVLLIISDDQAWGDYSFLGHPHIRTPHLDKLAGESLTYTRGYVASPLCRPSLASIFSGKYAHQHGITGNDPRIPPGKKRGRSNPELKPLYETIMDRIDDDPGLAHILGQVGYLSLQTGKWWEGDPKKRGGFTHAMTHGDPKRGGRHGDAGLRVSRQGIKPITDFITEAKEQEKPFFIWHAPFLPHTPHNPPARLFEKYRKKSDSKFVARYWAMCEWFDETCGELLAHLDKEGLRKNTVVLYVTDNGWIQSADSGRYAPRSKRSPNEGGIRTPIMIRWPGKVVQKFDEQTLVSSIDLAPTILKACGLKVPPTMDGIDLRDRAALGKRNAVFGAAYDHDIHDVSKPNLSVQTRFVVTGDWKLLSHHQGAAQARPAELYNLSVDPAETKNLAARHPGKVQQLRATLDTWWAGPETAP
ncbi:MAG: sulfatase [Roseibacillus sp.]|nr:sulfatase [Roseibacillus sp.]